MTNDEIVSYMDAYRKERKRKLIALMGGKCVRCGGTDNLQIDHIRREDKSFTVMDNIFKAWETILKEVAKCQLLCANCHTSKTTTESTKIVHGRINAYDKHGCRCPACKEAKRTTRKRYELRKRQGLIQHGKVAE